MSDNPDDNSSAPSQLDDANTLAPSGCESDQDADQASMMNQFEDMQSLMDAEESGFKSLRRRQVIKGVVVSVGEDAVLVDVGSKSEGIVPREELAEEGEEVPTLTYGQEILVHVIEPESPQGPVLSLRRARREQSWGDMEKLAGTNETLTAVVVDHNRGGAILDVRGLRGFVPLSQLVSLASSSRQSHDQEGGDDTQDRLARLHGTQLTLKVLEADRTQNRLILSERAAADDQRARKREELLAELQPGQLRTGRVRSIANFGAFIDLGGADGLVHLSELSHDRVQDPRRMLEVGQEVTVYVLDLRPESGKISLSLKRATPDPWDSVSGNYQPGQIVDVTVTRLMKFGAFAQVEPGVEGLIHVSELADSTPRDPGQVVNAGETVQAKIIHIDPVARRLGLSIRQVSPTETEAEMTAEQWHAEQARQTEPGSSAFGALAGLAGALQQEPAEESAEPAGKPRARRRKATERKFEQESADEEAEAQEAMAASAAEEVAVAEAALEDAVAEQVVVEEIATELAAAEEVAVAETALEEAVAEEVVVEEIATELEAAEEVAVAETVLEEAVAEEAVAEEVAVEEIAIELEAAEEVAVAEAALEEAVAEEVAVEETAIELESAEKLAITDAVLEEAVAEEVAVEETAIELESAEELAITDAVLEQAVAEEVAVEETAIELAADEELAVGEAAIEQAAAETLAAAVAAIEKEARAEGLSVGEVIAKEVALEEAVAEEVALKEAELEAAVAEEVAVEETAIELAAAEELEVAETVLEEEVAEEVAVDEAAIELASAEDVAVAETALEEAVAEQVAVEEAAIELASAEDVALAKTVLEEAVAEQVAVDEAAIELFSAEDVAVAETVLEGAVAEEVAAKEAVAEELAVEQTVAEEVALEEAVAEDVAIEQALTEEAAIEGLESRQDLSIEEVSAAETLVDDDTVEPVTGQAAAEQILLDEAQIEQVAGGAVEFEKSEAEAALVERALAQGAEIDESAAEEVVANSEASMESRHKGSESDPSKVKEDREEEPHFAATSDDASEAIDAVPQSV